VGFHVINIRSSLLSCYMFVVLQSEILIRFDALSESEWVRPAST